MLTAANPWTPSWLIADGLDPEACRYALPRSEELD